MIAMKVTLDDLTKLTGLSKSTISRAINHTGPVSKAAQIAIERAVTETGYNRKTVCHSGGSFASKMILMISTDINERTHTRYLKAFNSFFRERGYIVCALDCDFDLQNELSYLKFASENGFCGVFLLSLAKDGDSEYYHKLSTFSCPIVMINRQYSPSNFDAVCMDYYQAGFMSCEQLLKHGHKKIAILTGPENFYSIKNKVWGALDAIESYQCQIQVKQDITATEHADYHDGYIYGTRLVADRLPYTGVFCTNYALARGLSDALKALQVEVPQDISLVCTDNSWVGDRVPDITTISNNEIDIAFAAGELLLERIEHPEMPVRRVIFPATRVSGNSVADC